VEEATTMRQFVIQLANRPGELAHLSRALASRGIDIENISCAGAGSTACAFVVPSDPRAMREVLHGLGHEFVEGNAIVVQVRDEPGGLASIAERLAAANVNILGALVIGRRPGFLDMAFTVDDEARARAALGLAEPAARTH
jgi:hypothetical protein